MPNEAGQKNVMHAKNGVDNNPGKSDAPKNLGGGFNKESGVRTSKFVPRASHSDWAGE